MGIGAVLDDKQANCCLLLESGNRAQECTVAFGTMKILPSKCKTPEMHQAVCKASDGHGGG